jgi:hypothetical protein
MSAVLIEHALYSFLTFHLLHYSIKYIFKYKKQAVEKRKK